MPLFFWKVMLEKDRAVRQILTYSVQFLEKKRHFYEYRNRRYVSMLATPANKQDADCQMNIEPVQQGDKHKSKKRRIYRTVKRIFDLVGSAVLLVVCLIPMAVVALLIRLETSGPALFKQDRMGKDGKVFTIYKFRTMRLEAPRDMATRDVPDLDSYLTCVGKFLRRTSLDELPQLYNILLGEMSFVGYRPVCLTETDLNDLRKEYGVFVVRPGLTGLAQVRGRDSISFEEKARIDAEYVANRSVKLDLWCLLKTFAVVISKEGVI